MFAFFSGPTCARVGSWLSATALAAAIGVLGQPVAAGDLPADLPEQVEAHLSAGEFGPAVALAQQAPAAQRDRLLAQVAGVQNRAGARRAAINTAGFIDNDLVRSASLSDMSDVPIRMRPGAGGGGVEADFDSLIELIQSTVAPESWVDAGGAGAVAPFEGGVYVDASGLLKRKLRENTSNWLIRLRRASAEAAPRGSARKKSPLRKVSLTRLERAVQLKLAAGEPLDEEMLVLAGLTRVRYVFVYPETSDLVIAGPAGDWTNDAEGRVVSADHGHPVARLDDLVTIMRAISGQRDAAFGCSIDPRQEHLARTQAFLNESSRKPINASRRKRWLEQVRGQLGEQDIRIFGVDETSRVAQVLVEADYRMKLVGLGLEPSVPEVPQYLRMIKVAKGAAPPPMDVIRWWFTLNHSAIETSSDRDVFALSGQSVGLLSENELLTRTGGRVATGKAEPTNREFARNFTRHFSKLAQKHHVFAELNNLFDMAVIAALIEAEDLSGQANWHQTCFGREGNYPVPASAPPKVVDSVIAHRVVNRIHILAAASGGVRVQPGSLVDADAIQLDGKGTLASEHSHNSPRDLARNRWWWD